MEIVRYRRGLLTNTFDSLPKAPSCALTLEGMVLGGRETTGRLTRLDRDKLYIKNMELPQAFTKCISLTVTRKGF